MITLTMSDELEAAVIEAAGRKGLSVDDFIASVCKDALSLEVDRQRLQAYLDGDVAGVSQKRADAWLANLAAAGRIA